MAPAPILSCLPNNIIKPYNLSPNLITKRIEGGWYPQVDKWGMDDIVGKTCQTYNSLPLSQEIDISCHKLTPNGHFQGSPFPTGRRPRESKTTSRARTDFSSLFHISRSKNFKILEVGQVMILRKGKPCILWENSPSSVAAILQPCFQAHMTQKFKLTPNSGPGPESSLASTWSPGKLTSAIVTSWLYHTSCKHFGDIWHPTPFCGVNHRCCLAPSVNVA